MELNEAPKKVASLGVNIVTKNGLAYSMLQNLEVPEQITLQLVFSPMYNRTVQLNTPAL
jgi:hypothetical protein